MLMLGLAAVCNVGVVSKTEASDTPRVVAALSKDQFVEFKAFGVRDGSKLANIGLQDGDVIQLVDGVMTFQANEAKKVMGKLESASKLSLKVERRGEVLTIQFPSK